MYQIQEKLRLFMLAASICSCSLAEAEQVTISGSSQIESDPRFFSERLYSAQFRVLYFVGVQLLMSPSYHAGFTQ